MRSMKSWARLLLLALVLTVVPAGAAVADNVGPPGGCTPGYWKTHTDSWPTNGSGELQFATDDVWNDLLGGTGHPYTGVTLEEALAGGGGAGLEGATKILLRAATAALLNAAERTFTYPEGRGDIFDDVNAALASGDRATILALASYYDGLNNDLPCTLN